MVFHSTRCLLLFLHSRTCQLKVQNIGDSGLKWKFFYLETMRTNRGKRSKAFWPSIVMKKWLNIKPKVHEFSEDEVDTETESEDDACSLKDERMHVPEDHAQRTQGNPFTRPGQTSASTLISMGTSSTDYRLRHRRGKSKTLRAQYINTKDVRVTIGTWNVAGKLPNEDLEIDDWPCTEEPADIYIIGILQRTGGRIQCWWSYWINLGVLCLFWVGLVEEEELPMKEMVGKLTTNTM
ncbi:hypothetical protein I3760_07G059300 [Carya illinoinensis]|nr:hypothetical protein I3760_07G059300 [Carya illinoinensis]